MAILENDRVAPDLPGIVSELVKGFAVLARVQAPTMHLDHAFTTQSVVHSLLFRVRECGWEESADLLDAADNVLNGRLAPPR